MHTIVSAAAALRAGTASAVRLVERAIDAHARHGAATNAFIAFDAKGALAEAQACDADAARGVWRGPLHGIPLSIKDLIDVAGLPTTAGSRVLPSTSAARDAEIVARLRAAGAVILGKTNLHEFALGPTNEDSAFGAVRNPLDLARMSGGSSGGSAAAVATGIGLGSVGTDTGGSIRIPAALCGLVGLKPTHGEVPLDAVVPLSPTLDHAGPIAGSVADAAIMWSVMSGLPCEAEAAGDVKGLRLGIPSEYFFDLLEDHVRRSFDAALDKLAAAGAHIRHVSIPHASTTPQVYVPIVFREAWAWHRQFLETCPERYTAAVRARLETARNVGADEYERALAGRQLLTDEVDAALAEADALVLPATAVTAPLLGTEEITFGTETVPARATLLRLTQLFNITRHPAITLPIPHQGHLPAGLQLAGARNRTAHLLAAAGRIEASLA